MPYRSKVHNPIPLATRRAMARKNRKPASVAAAASDRLANTREGREMSRMFLADHPMCVGVLPDGRACGRPSEVMDHIVPHHGDGAKFFDGDNLQPLCKRCHSRKTAMQDGAFGNPSKKKVESP